LKEMKGGASQGSLIEHHANSFLFAPDNVAEAIQMVGVYNEIELAGNTDRTNHFEGRAGGRQVADGAADAAAAEFYRAGLKHALSKRNSVLIHRLELDPNLKNSVN
jgi:hypothetical protein